MSRPRSRVTRSSALFALLLGAGLATGACGVGDEVPQADPEGLGAGGVGGSASAGGGGALSAAVPAAPTFFCVAQPTDNQAVAGQIDGDYWSWFMSHMDEVGAAATRLSGPTLAWAMVEPVLGGGYDFSLADAFLDHMSPGQSPRELVMTINPMLGDDSRDPSGADRDAYLAFVDAVLQRYAPGGNSPYAADLPVRYFQVGNEVQDVPEGSAYVELVEVTAEAVRSSGLGVGLLGVGTFTRGREPVYDTLIPAIAERGLDDVFVGIDVHAWNADQLDAFVDKVGAIRDQLDEHGLGHVAIWSIENGTYQGCPTSPGPESLPAQSERDQALYLVEAMARSRLAGLGVYCWNNLVDWQAFDGDPEGMFSAMGLIGDGEGNGCEEPARGAQPRLAYYAFQRLAAELDQPDVLAVAEAPLLAGAEDVQGVTFTRSSDGAHSHLLFTQAATAVSVELEVSSQSVRIVPLITDPDGQAAQTEIDVSAGSVSVSVDGAMLVVEAGW